MTENTVSNTDNQKPWQFQPGQSGNPTGKPRGAQHKATQAMRTMLDGEAEAITRKVIDLAKEGDLTAIKICIDRIVPPLKSTTQPVKLNAPMPDNLTDTAKAFVSAAAAGELPPDIAAQLVSAVASVARVEEIEQLKHRLEAIERALKEQKK